MRPLSLKRGWKQDGKKQETGKRWRLGWWHLGHHKTQVIQGSISQYFSIIVPSLKFLFLFNFIFLFNLFKLKKKLHLFLLSPPPASDNH